MDHQGDRNEHAVSNDTIASLSFDFLKQLATLALATAGGAVTLLQTVLSTSSTRPLMILASGLLVISALFSLQAQQILVERLREGTSNYSDSAAGRFKLPRTAKAERRITVLSFAMFGAGLGLVIAAMLGA